MAVRRRGGARAREVHPEHAAQIVRDERVRLLLDPRGRGAVGGTAVRRVVLEPARARRIVRRRHDDAVGEAGPPAAVVGEDGVRDDGRRYVAAAGVDHGLDAVRRQHLERAREGRLRERVAVDPDEERPVGPLRFPIEADGLGDGEDVGFVERGVERRAAVPGGAESDALGRDRRIGALGVVRGHELREIDEDGDGSGLAGEGTDGHAAPVSQVGPFGTCAYAL